MFLIIILASCETNSPTGVCGDGHNLCFEINGNEKSFDTQWTGDSHYCHINGTEINGVDTQTISLVSYYHLEKGSYNMAPCLIEFCGIAFHYTDSITYYVQTGTLNLTNLNANRVTGDFNAVLCNTSDTNSVILTNGHLDAIPH